MAERCAPFDASDSVISLPSSNPINKMFRLFFEHLKSTITRIDIFMHDREDPRDMDVKLSDFKDLIDIYRDQHKMKKAKKSTRASAKASAAHNTSPGPSDAHPPPFTAEVPIALASANDYLRSLGIDLTTFCVQATKLVDMMSTKDPWGYINRSDKDYCYRLTATSGLIWTTSSKNRTRDFAQAASCAIFESVLVMQYRKTLISNCHGVAAMRKQLGDYLFSISKANAQEPVLKPGDQTPYDKPLSKKEWYFADFIPFDNVPPPSKNMANHEELQKRLELSHVNSANRKNNEISRCMNIVMNSPFAACANEDAEPGTIETVVYNLLVHLNFVGPPLRTPRHLACSHVSLSL